MAKQKASPKNLRRFHDGYRPGKFRVGAVRAALYGLFGAFAVFFLVPFTQILSGLEKQDRTVGSFDIAPPPPPPPPELEEPPDPPPQEEPPPQMSEPPPPLSLTQLEMALTPGIGDAMTASFGGGFFEVQPDAVADLDLFDVSDLDELPRPITNPRMPAPFEARRERISGLYRIEIEINQNGDTRVIKVLEATPERFREEAIQFVQTIKWTPPKKNGEPVRARYIIPTGWNF